MFGGQLCYVKMKKKEFTPKLPQQQNNRMDAIQEELYTRNIQTILVEGKYHQQYNLIPL